MNKSISVLLAVLLLSACAAQPVPVESGNSMIDFADIANEISVNYQSLDGTSDGPLNSRRRNAGNDEAPTVGQTTAL